MPDNDFHDMSLAYWKSIGEGSPDYRPYYADDLFHHLCRTFSAEPGQKEFGTHSRSVFPSAYLASYHVGQYIYSRFLLARP